MTSSPFEGGLSPTERVGLLILRAWVDPGNPAGEVRIRLLLSRDPEGRQHDVEWASSVEETVEMVESWLRGVVRGSAD